MRLGNIQHSTCFAETVPRGRYGVVRVRIHDASFPLTPALSPGERVKLCERCGYSAFKDLIQRKVRGYFYRTYSSCEFLFDLLKRTGGTPVPLG